LVATCHGWINETARTRLYNRIDLATAFVSDVVTVPDYGMLAQLPRAVERKYVPNGVDNRAPATEEQRRAARAQFKLSPDAMIVGVLGRLEEAKGMRDVLESARRTVDIGIHWAFAGSGPLEDEIRRANLPNVTLLGYVSDSARYLDALDVYLQASHTEGLSLSLLEAMRAQLPIVATPVGATAEAARHTREALLVRTGDVGDIIRAVRLLRDNEELASHLAAAARRRFEDAFTTQSQHQAFLEIYRACGGVQL
jgi:glycosyltransferase involved in cell wall biosynthesis